mgnify:CR=1 FL=1
MNAEVMTQKPPSSVVNIWKFVVGFAVIFAVAAAAGLFFREPIYAFGSLVVGKYGLVGLAISVLLVDSLPTPLSYVPFMALALAGGLSFGEVLIVSSIASYCAGCLGYGVGRLVGMPPRFERWIHARYPRVQSLLDRYGGWGVAAIAVLPLPLAVGTWSAGSLKVRTRQVVLALLLRVPKTLIYLVVIERGLSLGAG